MMTITVREADRVQALIDQLRAYRAALLSSRSLTPAERGSWFGRLECAGVSAEWLAGDGPHVHTGRKTWAVGIGPVIRDRRGNIGWRTPDGGAVIIPVDVLQRAGGLERWKAYDYQGLEHREGAWWNER